jgi:hypothetical protein
MQKKLRKNSRGVIVLVSTVNSTTTLTPNKELNTSVEKIDYYLSKMLKDKGGG